MNYRFRHSGQAPVVLCLALALVLSNTNTAAAQTISHVYMMTNASSGNSVLDYLRNSDGTLTLSTTVPTGGIGAGVFLNSVGAVTLDSTKQFLFVVNAGENTVSSFKIGVTGPVLVSRVASGGTLPVSVTSHLHRVFVLNQGGGANNNISGLTLNTTTGALSPLANSTQLLSGPSVMSRQISFTPSGGQLIVTEKGTSLIDIFPVVGGLPQPPTLYTSASPNPYGFAFDAKGRVYITDAGVSGLASYSLTGGVLSPITPFIQDDAGAACWLTLNPAGTFAYVINNLNGSLKGGVSVYSVSTKGQIALRKSMTIQFGIGGTDSGITADGVNFYVLLMGGLLNAYHVNSNGSLSAITGLTGLASTTEGMAVT